MTQDFSDATYSSVTGGKELLKWFGRVPDFHDAEILDLHLKRAGASTLRIHAWNMTNRVRNKKFILEKHAVVEFSFGWIVNLELDQFNQQNVIDKLTVSRVRHQEKLDLYEVSWEPAYGLGGVIQAAELSISHYPGNP